MSFSQKITIDRVRLVRFFMTIFDYSLRMTIQDDLMFFSCFERFGISFVDLLRGLSHHQCVYGRRPEGPGVDGGGGD